MKIIQEREVHEEALHFIRFARKDDPGCGFSVTVDEHGTPATKQSKDIWEEWRQHGTMRGHKVTPRNGLAVETTYHRWGTPRIGLCDLCGAEVELEGDPCPCDCGAFYNSFGQRLAHPSQWGEETGEYYSDSGQYLGGGDN